MRESGERALNKLTGVVRRCLDDYTMIDEGETVAVGVSGGKDSLTLLAALAHLRKFYPKRYELHAVTIDFGFSGMDFSPVGGFCAELGVPYTVRKKDAADIIWDERRKRNDCSLCSKIRRGALHDLILELGIRKIALAHHFDDAVETFMLSLLYESRINCFQPVTYMSRAGVTQIRPLLLVNEQSIGNYAETARLPVVRNTCPSNGFSKREDVKVLIRQMELTYPGFKDKVFSAMRNYPLKGWAGGR